MIELKPCPFCGEDKAVLAVYDEEGNFKGLSGCDYEDDPWSGISYGIYHIGRDECLLCGDGFYSSMGNLLFDTAEEAAEMWNRRVDTIHAAGGCYCRECKYCDDRETGYGDERVCKRWSEKNLISSYTVPNDFCSYGEKETAGE